MDISSKREDTLRAIYYIKNALKDDVMINRINPKGSIVTGRYCHSGSAIDTRKSGIPFSLSYDEDAYMRLLVMADDVEHTNEELLEALSSLGRTLSRVTNYRGEVVGRPTVSYSMMKENKRFLSMDWAFVDENEYLRALGISTSDSRLDLLNLGEEYNEEGSIDRNSDKHVFL